MHGGSLLVQGHQEVLQGQKVQGPHDQENRYMPDEKNGTYISEALSSEQIVHE
jgi:hypothetical protein